MAPSKEKPPLPPGVIARAGTRDITLKEFHVWLARDVRDELDTAGSGPATVLQIVMEETSVRQEAGRLGITVTQHDYEVQRKIFDDQIREKSHGEQSLDDVLKIKKMTEEEFRGLTEDVIRKDRIASHPSYLGASLPKEPSQRVAQIELVMLELMKKAKIERTGLPEGVAFRVNGQPITEEAFGAALDLKLAPTEVQRRLQKDCFTILMDAVMGAGATQITDAQLEEEIEAQRPMWLRSRDEAVEAEYQSLSFEAFLQMRFNAPVEELKRSPYHRGIFGVRRKFRAAIQPDEVKAAWVRGANDEYGASIAISEIVVGFRASNTVSETVKRRDQEEALRILRDFERRIRGNEPLAVIEKELKDAKDRGEKGVIFVRRLIFNHGNDLLLFEPAKSLAKDGDWAAPVTLLSEAHLMRRDAFRKAPTFDEIAPIVKERIIDLRAREWLEEQKRDIQYAPR